MTPPWPVELVFRRQLRELSIRFDDGFEANIPYAVLRRESPSADVQGHGPGQKRDVPEAVDAMVVSAEAVGRYAVRLVFVDGHRNGLYTWSWLRGLAEAQGKPIQDEA